LRGFIGTEELSARPLRDGAKMKTKLKYMYEFEKHPKLTEFVQEMASSGKAPQEWTSFIETLNQALREEKMYTREEVEAIAAKFLLLGFGKSAEGRNAEILCESRWLEEMFPEHFESIEIFTKDNL
jgi:hypothetical protein